MKRPTDFFGMGTAIRAFLSHLEQASRRTGRTQRLVDATLPGDRIICATEEDARHLRRRLRAADKDVQVSTCPPDISPVSRFSTSPGRTWFDHRWVEAIYNNALASAERDILSLEAAMSKRHPLVPRSQERTARNPIDWDPTGGAT